MVIHGRKLSVFMILLALILALSFDGFHLLQDLEFNGALAAGNAA